MRSTRFTSVALAVLGALLVCGLTVRRLHGDDLIVPLLLAALVVTAVVLRPTYAVLVALVLTYVVPRPFPLSFAGVRTDAGELLCYAVILAWVVHGALTRSHLRSTYSRSVFVLAVGIVMGALVGWSNGADDQLLKGQTKAYLLYLLILPFGAFFGSPEGRLRLERWVVAVATAGAVYVLGELALGHDVAPGGSFNTLGVEASATRLKPAALELAVVAFMLVLARVITSRPTVLRIVQLVVFLVLFGLSFYRSLWVGLILGIAFLVIAAPGRHRGRRVAGTAVVVALVAPLVMVLAAGGVLGQSGREVPRRLASVFSPEITRDSSFTDRSSESAHALDTLGRSPWVGVGIASPYGATVVSYSDQLHRYLYVDRPWSHNSYLQLYLQLGLVGVLGLLLLALRAGTNVRAQLRGRLAHPDGAVVAAAAAAALLALAFKATFNTQLLERPAILALVTALTLAHVPLTGRHSPPRQAGTRGYTSPGLPGGPATRSVTALSP